MQATGQVWDGPKLHIPCLAHVVQLVVKALVDNLRIDTALDTVPASFDEEKIGDVSQVSFGTTL